MNPHNVTVYQIPQPAQTQTVQQTPVPSTQRSQTLSYKWLGIVQMCIGPLCIVLSVIGIIVGYNGIGIPNDRMGTITAYGSGIYTGIFYVIAGLLGFLAYRNNNRCLVVACMIINIIATCATVVGLFFVSMEFSAIVFLYSPYPTLQTLKCIIIIICCSIEFIITIVHAAFSCAFCCQCCQQKDVVDIPGQIISTSVHPLPQTTIIPGQVYHLPPHQHVTVQKQHPDQMVPQQAIRYHQQQQLMGNNTQVTVIPAFNYQHGTSNLQYNHVT